jgi:chemotaxis protein histidine kinase CheA
VRLSHRAEDVLNSLRKGEVQLTHPMMDALLSARDYLGKMLQDIREGGLKEYELGALLNNLESVQTVGQASPSLGQLLVKQEVITPAALSAVLAEQSSSAEPRKLGQMLVDKGLASPAEVGDALVRQKEIGAAPPRHRRAAGSGPESPDHIRSRCPWPAPARHRPLHPRHSVPLASPGGQSWREPHRLRQSESS